METYNIMAGWETKGHLHLTKTFQFKKHDNIFDILDKYRESTANQARELQNSWDCLLYTSDAADD